MSDLPANPVEILTREDVSLIARQVIGDLVRTEVANGISLAFVSVPTKETVERMIEQALTPVRQQHTDDLHSVDRHLREAEGKISAAVRRLDAVSDQFPQFMMDVRGEIGRLVAENEANKVRLSAVELQQAQTNLQGVADRNEIRDLHNKFTDLRNDIHGDPNEPNTPSLFTMQLNRTEEANAQHKEVLRRIDALDTKTATQEKYIETRRGLELQLMGAITKLIGSKWIIAAAVAAIAAVGGAELYEVLLRIFVK